MDLTKDDLIKDAKEYIDLIKDANKPRRSRTRDAYLDAARQILTELRAADKSDTNELKKLDGQLATLDDSAGSIQGQTLIQWTSNYADAIDDLGNFLDGRKTERFGTPIKFWFAKSKSFARRLKLYKSGQSKKKTNKITEELRELYVILLTQRLDGRLSLESGLRLKKLENKGFLTPEDLPNLNTILLNNRIGGVAARNAARMLARSKTLKKLHEKAKDAANPSIFRRAWDWFGWDSFTDFAIDLGLIFATGGAGAVGVWGRRAAKGVKNLRKISKAKKFKRVAQQYDKALRETEDALKRARNRLRRRGHSRKAQKTAKRLERQYRRLVKFWFETGEDAFQSFKSKKEFFDTIKSAWKLISKVLQSVGANSIQESLGIAKGKAAGEIATKEIAKAALKIPVNELRDLSEKIKNAQEALTKGESLGAKSSRRQLALNWYKLLLVRQFIVRSLERFFRKGSPPSLSDHVGVFIKSLISALEEALIAYYVPSGMIAPVLVQLEKVARKVLAGVIVTFFKNLIDDGTISFKAPP